MEGQRLLLTRLGLLVVVVLSITAVGAKTYEIEWDTSPPNLYELRQGAKLDLGDQLHFTYNSQDHNVLEVSLAAFLECDTLTPENEWIGGDTTITLSKPKIYYFIDGLQGHCFSRQFLVVTVRDHYRPSAPAPSPVKAPAPTPTPAPQANTTLAKPPPSPNNSKGNILRGTGQLTWCLLPLVWALWVNKVDFS